MNTETTSATPTTPDITLPAGESDHRGNGKVARLPKVLRDQVNRMLDDGFSYKAIIEKLELSTAPPLPYKLLEINISRWKDHGYQHYLRRQEWRDELRIVRESGSEMTELADGPKFQETLVQVALTEIFRVLQQRELKTDSLNYIRLLNALARLNREALGLRKYNDHLAKEEVQLKQLDPNRKLTDNEHRAIADIIDQVMEMPRPRPLWSAPAERSGDGALVDSNQATYLRTPAGCAELTSADDSAIENPKSKIQNPSPSPLPSRPCQADTPAPTRVTRPTKNRKTKIQNPKSKIENCLECGTALPPVPPDARRRPDDHCPSCGMRLPDIGLCEEPGFDKCLNCGATQPHLLPNGERPRPSCHKCGERLHNPEPPTT